MMTLIMIKIHTHNPTHLQPPLNSHKHSHRLSHTHPPTQLHTLVLFSPLSFTRTHTYSLSLTLQLVLLSSSLSLSLSGEEQILYRHHDEVLGQEVELIEAGKRNKKQ